MTIAIGIDFEHIRHTPAYRSLNSPLSIPIDIPGVTNDILELLGKYNVRATFFVVSELATEYPQVVRQIVAEGHEIASHTVTHQSLTNGTQDVLQSEISESKSQLESITRQAVSGFRAPTCQINDRVYKELIEVGYEYSSSVMPSIPIPGFYSNVYDFAEPVVISSENGQIMELPLSVSPLLKVPISGAWVRLLGKAYINKSVQQLLNRNLDVITYSHPWEFVPLQKTPLPFRNRVRTGEWFSDTFEQLLQFDAEYCRVSDLATKSDFIHSYYTNE